MKVDTKTIWRKIQWLIVIAIGLFCLWFFFLKPIGKGNKELFNELTKVNQERAKDEQEARKIDVQNKQEILNKLTDLEIKVQQVQATYDQSQQVLKNINVKLQDLPTRIMRLTDNKDSLRRAAIED